MEIGCGRAENSRRPKFEVENARPVVMNMAFISRKMLQNEFLIAKAVVDTAENSRRRKLADTYQTTAPRGHKYCSGYKKAMLPSASYAV